MSRLTWEESIRTIQEAFEENPVEVCTAMERLVMACLGRVPADRQGEWVIAFAVAWREQDFETACLLALEYAEDSPPWEREED